MKNMHIKLFKPKKIEQVLIAVHGFAGDSDSSVITAIADELNNHNVLVVAFDLPCHGKDKKTGTLNLKDCLDYITKVEDYVQITYKNLPISYFATSFGGYLLLNHINNTNQQYKNIILRAPAVFMSKIIKEKLLAEHGYTFKDLQNKTLNMGYEKELNIDINFYNNLVENSLKDFKNTTFLHIIQGKKDDIVNFKQNELYFNENCKNSYKMYYFENADHRFKNIGELEKIVDIVKVIML